MTESQRLIGQTNQHLEGIPMTRSKSVAISLAALSILGGCTQPQSDVVGGVPVGLNQGEYCETNELTAPADCKPGQRVVFLPSRFGNEQLPVLFAAANCDLRYSVVLTNGGVTCIYHRVTAALPAPQAPASKEG